MRKLDELQVLEPCQADWDQFAGGDKVRFCSTCGKNVYNLSAMSRGVAERSLRRTGGTICTRFARSPDGRIVTEGPAAVVATRRAFGRMAGALMTVLVGLQTAFGQKEATIFGVLTDSQGAFVEGATVTLTNQGNGKERATKTDTTGAYRFERLEGGPCTVRITASGFDSFRKMNIAGGSINATLQVGTVGGGVLVPLQP